jgi:hypothetical protein
MEWDAGDIHVVVKISPPLAGRHHFPANHHHHHEHDERNCC